MRTACCLGFCPVYTFNGKNPEKGTFSRQNYIYKNQLHITENVFSKIALDIFTQSKNAGHLATF
jgi:hypothetical protein